MREIAVLPAIVIAIVSWAEMDTGLLAKGVSPQASRRRRLGLLWMNDQTLWGEVRTWVKNCFGNLELMVYTGRMCVTHVSIKKAQDRLQLTSSCCPRQARIMASHVPIPSPRFIS